MDVYVIAGNTQTRKSSSIRALTGVWGRRTTQVRTREGADISIYVQIQSLEEEGIDANQFILRVEQAQPHATHVLVPVRVGGAIDHIDAFREHGWNMADVVVFGQTWPVGGRWADLTVDFHPSLAMPHTANVPANDTAHRLRSRWGWR